MRNARRVAAVAVLVLLVAGCGGNSVEEELAEQILENSGEGVGNVEVDTDGDGNVSVNVEGEDGGNVSISSSGDDDELNMTIEGDDGEDVTITGSGDDDEMTITVEGEDGGTMTIGGGDIPESLTLPVPDGGEVMTVMEMEDGAMVFLIFPLSEYDSILSFYESSLPSDAMKMEVSQGDQLGVTWTGDTFVVSVNTCDGEGGTEIDSTCVNLNQFG
jgi:hypothetical protein